jgi:hypothetical protein
MEEPISTKVSLPRSVLDWLCKGRGDYRHFQRRKVTRTHLAKRNICLWVWLAAASLILVCPAPGCMVTLLLGATFLRFAVLDGE